jgi:hypothetical protein
MSEQKRPLYQIPEPSTDSVTDAIFQLLGRRASLLFDYYRDGVPCRSAFKFSGVIASRTTAERCCTKWHVENCYDVLCEVEGSSWLAAVKCNMPARYHDELSARHFMIYLDSAGCFEVLADGLDAPTEEIGSWEGLQKNLLN